MKKLLSVLIIAIINFSIIPFQYANAELFTKQPRTKNTSHYKKDGTPDRRFKEHRRP